MEVKRLCVRPSVHALSLNARARNHGAFEDINSSEIGGSLGAVLRDADPVGKVESRWASALRSVVLECLSFVRPFPVLKADTILIRFSDQTSPTHSFLGMSVRKNL